MVKHAQPHRPAAQFHIESGPSSLFDRVRFIMTGPRLLRFDPDQGRPSEAPPQLLHFDPRVWQAVTADVRTDSGKFIRSGWTRKVNGQHWYVVIGFDVIEAAVPLKQFSVRDDTVRSGPLYEFVQATSTALMQGDTKAPSGPTPAAPVKDRNGHVPRPGKGRSKVDQALVKHEQGLVSALAASRQWAAVSAATLASCLTWLRNTSETYFSARQWLKGERDKRDNGTLQLDDALNARYAGVHQQLQAVKPEWDRVCRCLFKTVVSGHLPKQLQPMRSVLLARLQDCKGELFCAPTARFLWKLEQLLAPPVDRPTQQGTQHNQGTRRRGSSAVPLNWEDASAALLGRATSGGSSAAWQRLQNTGAQPILAPHARRFGR